MPSLNLEQITLDQWQDGERCLVWDGDFWMIIYHTFHTTNRYLLHDRYSKNPSTFKAIYRLPKEIK